MGRHGRTHKHLSRIILLGDMGEDKHVYTLDENGRLITKFSPEKKTDELAEKKVATKPKHRGPTKSPSTQNFPLPTILASKTQKSRTPAPHRTITTTHDVNSIPNMPNPFITKIDFSTSGLFSTSPLFKPLTA